MLAGGITAAYRGGCRGHHEILRGIIAMLRHGFEN